MYDGSRIGAMEDVFKIFVVEGGATRASAIEGAFAIALVTVGESGEETIHELVGSIAATAKAPTDSLLDVDPFDVFEDLDRPVFHLHDVELSIIRWRRKSRLRPVCGTPPITR